MTSLELFRILMLLLSFSTSAQYMGCDAPPISATQCWIVQEEAGTMAVLSPAGITYPAKAEER